MSQVVIYHNPRCSKSRATLALLQERGLEPRVIESLETPLDAGGLEDLAKKRGSTFTEIIRRAVDTYLRRQKR